jgi:hypothetical protein
MSESQLPCIISESRTCKAIPSEKLVFIIGSGSSEFSKDVQKIKKVLKGFDLEGYFALLSEKEKGLDSFCDKICSKIMGSVFCIAMLNDPIVHEYPEESNAKKFLRAPRANVYYELGIAVALGKKIIPVIRKDMKLPFDVQHVDAITYENHAELQKKLKSAVRVTLLKGISRHLLKMPKLRLLLIDGEGKASEALTVKPIITKIRYVEMKDKAPTKKPAILITRVGMALNNVGLKSPTVDKARIPLGIEIWNDGEIPAENILVTLEFPKDCVLFETQYFSPDVLGLAATATIPHLNYGGLHIDYQDESIAKAWVKRLGNDRGLTSFQKIYVRFNTEEERTFEINGKIVQDNYPQRSFAFTIIVKPKIVEEIRYKEGETENPE